MNRPAFCITVSVKKLLHYRAGGLLQYRAFYYIIGSCFYYIIGHVLQYRAFITLSVGTRLVHRVARKRIQQHLSRRRGRVGKGVGHLAHV